MESCFFPCFFPKQSEFVRIEAHEIDDGENNSQGGQSDENDNCDRNRMGFAGRRLMVNGARSKPSPLKVDADGMLQVPKYTRRRREKCPLLQACWEQNWDEVLYRCAIHPEEAASVTQHSGRTALHLATFNHPSPLHVAQALLKANRHMVLVQDANWYTPLHNVAFFPGESLVKLFCDTASMVEQELQGQGEIPPTYGTSPLFLAAKRAAPLRTLRYLLETRVQQQSSSSILSPKIQSPLSPAYPKSELLQQPRQRRRTEWIAPSTGGEPYWMDTLDEYSSPLEILLRNRAIDSWGFLLNKSEESLRISHGCISKEERVPPNHFQWLIHQMRRLAVRRLSEIHSKLKVASSGTQFDAEDNTDDEFEGHELMEKDLEALSLWAKCIELMAEYVPYIQISTTMEDSDDFGHMTSYFGVLHTIARTKVPSYSLLRMALLIFPEQALQKDEVGMLPIHHVLMARHPYATKTMVEILMEHAPQAATWSTKSTPTPLVLALQLQAPMSILELLLLADSDGSLGIMDSETELYPFAVAALMRLDLDVIYTLLIRHPQILSLQFRTT